MAAGVSMPVAAVDKHHGLSREFEIGCAWKRTIMKSEAKAQPVKPLAKDLLRLGILPADAGHHPGPNFRVDDVCHGWLF